MKKINFEDAPSTKTPLSATNLNLIQANAEEAINEIIKSGSNANGTYMKYADGTLICHGKISGTCQGQSGLFTFGSQAFPMDFTAQPTLQILVAYFQKGEPNLLTGVSDYNQIREIKIRCNSDAPTSNITFFYVALGRWK